MQCSRLLDTSGIGDPIRRKEGSHEEGKVSITTFYIENGLWIDALCNDESCSNKQYKSVLTFLFLEKMTIGIKWYIRVHTCSVTQSCWTLCSSVDCDSPGSSVHGIFQARILEWVAISYSKGSSWPRDWPTSPASPALVGRFFTTEPPRKSQTDIDHFTKEQSCIFH